MRQSSLLYLKVITTVTIISLVTLACVSKLGRVAEVTHSQTNIERYWVEAETKEGFMEVKDVLSDPRTTVDTIINVEELGWSG